MKLGDQVTKTGRDIRIGVVVAIDETRVRVRWPLSVEDITRCTTNWCKQSSVRVATEADREGYARWVAWVVEKQNEYRARYAPDSRIATR